MSTNTVQKDIDKLIDAYFNQPDILYTHLKTSYEQFVTELIPYSLIQESNYFYENVDQNKIFLHGFKCSNIHLKPSVFDNTNEIKFPSDARKNHLNYFGTIVADIQQYVEIVDSITGEKNIKQIGQVENEIPVASIPIMIKSKFCSTTIKQDLKGECRIDPGGYFIVNGAEKIVMSMEKMVDNKVLIFTKKDPSFDSGLIYSAQINSRKNDWSDNLQILTIKNRKDGVFTISTSSQLVDIPLFILMRALGVETDENIISYITYNLEDTKMLNLIRPSVSNSLDENDHIIRTKEEATEYLINKLRRNKRISQTDEALAKIQKKMYLEKILRQDLLPHLGEDIPKKIMFLGYMVNKLLNVMLGRQDVDDRDALNNKRIEPPGILLGLLFRQNWKKMLSEIGKHFKKKNQSDETPINVIGQIKPSIIEQGLKTALATGIWGMNKNKKGVAQSLQRLSWVQGISYLRRILAPSMDESTAKVTSIRHVNNNQAQLLCLTGETEILLSDKMTLKQIKDIADGDNVTTINPQNLNEEPSTMFNKFSRMSEKLLQITTLSGRVIKATPEHPFLIDVNGKPTWKDAGLLTPEDKIIIRHVEKMISTVNQDTIVTLDSSSSQLTDEYKSELTSANYFSAPIAQDRLISIARLFGAITKLESTADLAIINVETYDDALTVSNDINNLNLGQASISKNMNGKWSVSKDGSFMCLLKLLGYSTKREVPQWIMNGNQLIKREYLSSLQGINGSPVKFLNHDLSVSLFYTYQLVYNEFLLETIDYMNQVSQLFKSFDIQTYISASEVPPTVFNNKVMNLVQLAFTQSLENISKYSDMIGYRYCENKRVTAAYSIENLKVLQQNNFDRTKSINIINKSVSVNIKEIITIPNELVYDFTTHSDNHSFIASSFNSSNCPVETPEGAKIGIVKSLAMMSSISTQNMSQAGVLKSLIKDNKHIKHPYDIDPLSMLSWIKIIFNGDWVGVCKITHGQEIHNMFKQKRRESVIDRYTSIVFDYRNKEIRLYFDGGRLIRPVLIVNNNKLGITPEVMKDVNTELATKDKTKAWKKIINKYPNLIEYEDIESLNYLLVAESEQRLTEAIEASKRTITYTDATKINRYGDYRWVNYTHCDFHAWTMMGTVVANIPFSNHNYANRNIIHFSQAKQSIGTYLTSYKDRMDISQVLYHPQVPLVTTRAMEYNGCYDLPYGENTIVAIASYNGFNQEDSIILNQTAIDRGLMRADTLKKFPSEIMKNPSTSQDDEFTKPDRNKVTGMKQGNYDKLNEKGYAPEESIINNEDIIIGKVSPIQPTGNNNKVYKDSSTIFKTNVQGVIDRVHTGIYNNDGYEMYNVRVRMERKPIAGDKFTCYDDSHEVLTDQGWINIKDVNMRHKIASLDDSNNMIYQNPTEVQSYDYKGKMYLVESNHVSLCVTPNHRMYVRGRETDYKTELAEDIIGKRKYYKKNADNFIPEINKEYFVYNDNNEITHFKISDTESFEINDWLIFFGIWLAEGFVDKCNMITKFAAHKQRVKNELLRCFNNLGFKYYTGKDHKNALEKDIWCISKKQLATYLFQYSLGSVNKFLPLWVWNLTPTLCKKLIEGMMLGDGHTMKNGTRRYDTSSKKLADDFQRLCLHAGYATNIALKYKAGHESYVNSGKSEGTTIKSTCDAYRLTIIEKQVEPIVNKTIQLGNQQDKFIDFEGKVYCCTVPGKGIIYIRRESIGIFCGNSRHGQKGTVGICYKQKDMPFTESGIVPDLILNPHGYPSRMSLGHFIECLASKEAAATGKFVDGTPFNNYDISKLPEVMKKLGFSAYGTDAMYCGLTGRKMDVEIFIGPIFSIRLKHMVLDKVHGRARGPKQSLTRQPLEGRSRDGGLKIGEMEKDAIVAHGMGQFLKERTMETSDISKVYVCDDCGMFAAKAFDKDFYKCDGCRNSTRISAVVIPHACKLLFQELTSVNILPRIRTEHSIYADES